MDTNNDGKISWNEFVAGLKNKPKTKSQPTQRHKYMEFVDPQLQIAKEDRKQAIAKAKQDLVHRLERKYTKLADMFVRVDRDRCGYIGREEVLTLAKNFNLSLDHIDSVFDCIDTNEDGKIAYQEAATHLKFQDWLNHPELYEEGIRQLKRMQRPGEIHGMLRPQTEIDTADQMHELSDRHPVSSTWPSLQR